jgi:hypothetical protein
LPRPNSCASTSNGSYDARSSTRYPSPSTTKALGNRSSIPEALDNKVSEARDYEATLTLTREEEARYGALLDTFKDARGTADFVAGLHRAIPPERQGDALRGTLAHHRALHTGFGLPVRCGSA